MFPPPAPDRSLSTGRARRDGGYEVLIPSAPSRSEPRGYRRNRPMASPAMNHTVPSPATVISEGGGVLSAGSGNSVITPAGPMRAMLVVPAGHRGRVDIALDHWAC